MSTRQQISDSLEAEVREEGSPDVGSSETNPVPSMISVDVPALISDKIENFPEEPKNPEVTQDPPEESLGALEQASQAGPSRSLPQEQPVSGATDSVLNKH